MPELHPVLPHFHLVATHDAATSSENPVRVRLYVEPDSAFLIEVTPANTGVTDSAGFTYPQLLDIADQYNCTTCRQELPLILATIAGRYEVTLYGSRFGWVPELRVTDLDRHYNASWGRGELQRFAPQIPLITPLILARGPADDVVSPTPAFIDSVEDV